MAFSAVYQKLCYQIVHSHSTVMFFVEKSTTLKETMPLFSTFILLCHRAAPSIINMSACGVAIPLLRHRETFLFFFPSLGQYRQLESPSLERPLSSWKWRRKIRRKANNCSPQSSGMSPKLLCSGLEITEWKKSCRKTVVLFYILAQLLASLSLNNGKKSDSFFSFP